MSTATKPADLGPRLLGAVGVTLLLAAAISVVSARWELFGPGARLGALLVASGVLVVLTGQVRRLAPSTAQMLDVLVAAMVPIDTAAAVIVSGGSWRSALVAAGPVTVVVGAVLRRRAAPLVGDIAIGVGGGLAVAGIAAEVELDGPLVLGLLALVVAALAPNPRDRWVAAGWAMVGGLAPAARVLDEVVFTGMGTMRELGLIDPVTLLVALGAGGFAAAALLVVGVRNGSTWAGIAAAAVVLATGLEAWAITDPPRHVGLLAVAVVLALLELADLRRLALSSSLVDELERLNEGALIAMTGLVATGSWMVLVDEPGVLAESSLTAGVVAATWMIGQLRRGAEEWLPALPGLVIAGSAAAHLATGDARVLAATLLVGSVVATLLGRRTSTGLALAAATLAPLVVLDTDGTAIAITAWVAMACTTFAVLRARPVDDAVVAYGLLTILVHGVIAVGAATFEWSPAVAVSVVAGLWWTIGLALDRVQPVTGTVLRSLALMGPIVLVPIDPTVSVALAGGLTLAAAAEFAVTRAPERLALAAAAAAVTCVAGLRSLEVELLDLYVVPLLWCGAWAIVRAGAPRTATHVTALVVTAAVAIVGRLDDGLSVHTAILGAVAVVVAVGAARAGDRSTLAVAGPVAVAAATFDLLDRSVGVESWGWLLVGGAAAVSAAVVLERRDTVAGTESTAV